VLQARRELGWFRCFMFRLRQRKWRREAGYQVKEVSRPRKLKRLRKAKAKSKKRQFFMRGLKSKGGWPWQRWWQKRHRGLRR